MIGIIGAMQEEVDFLKSVLENAKTEVVSGTEYVCGTAFGTEAVVAMCGVGKVNAAVCAQTMILKYHANEIINTGVAGGLSPNLKVGDIAIAGAVVEHDMDTSPLGDPKGFISGLNMIELPCAPDLVKELEACCTRAGASWEKGVIASGDQFIASGEKKREIRETFGAVACEMEGGSIGHVCRLSGVPFAVLRAISDSADDSSHLDYPQFLKLAAKKSIEIMCSFLQQHA